MMKSLTLIVPTYNVEKYIEKCLNSLVVDRDDLEVLVIIDGATDSSVEIAKRFQNRNPNTFKVIEKDNGHYGSCVNVGLSLATGKYVKLLDADDSFDSNLSEFLNLLNGVDVDLVISDYITVDENDAEIKFRRFFVEAYRTQSIERLIEKDDMIIHHASIAYRTDLLKEMSYRQTEGICYTDLEWITLPFAKVSSFAYFPKILYKYLLGRSGQSVDIEYHKKNMWMEHKVLLGLAEQREKLKGEVDSFHSSIVTRITTGYIRNLYYNYILRFPKHLNESELKEFDNNLRLTSKEIYYLLEESKDVRKFGTFYYIKDFREKGTRNTIKYCFYDVCMDIGSILNNRRKI